MKVLIVDDNDTNRLLATHVLKGDGWTVCQASGGLEAMSRLDTEKFDAVLLDVSMPHLAGDQLCRWIRTHDEISTLPVVAYTAHILPQEVAKLREVGFNHVITKPVSRDALTRQMRAFVPGART